MGAVAESAHRDDDLTVDPVPTREANAGHRRGADPGPKCLREVVEIGQRDREDPREALRLPAAPTCPSLSE
jgi:hypothetical protein